MKLLCPIDFSSHSIIALEYAINLAYTLDAEVHILTVYKANKSSTSFGSMDELIRKNHEEDMSAIINGLGSLIRKDNIPITRVAKGHTVSTILRYTKQKEIDLIVMGTQGGNSLRTTLFGSTTKKLGEKTTVPILAIPESVKHSLSNNRLVLALDNKILDNESLFKIPLLIAKSVDQKIDILHVKDKGEMIPFDPYVSAYLSNAMGEVHLIESDDTIAGIKAYADENNIGMLMMIRREKSFLQKLLLVGNTSAELAKTSIPLLILPE